MIWKRPEAAGWCGAWPHSGRAAALLHGGIRWLWYLCRHTSCIFRHHLCRSRWGPSGNMSCLAAERDTVTLPLGVPARPAPTRSGEIEQRRCRAPAATTSTSRKPKSRWDEALHTKDCAKSGDPRSPWGEVTLRLENKHPVSPDPTLSLAMNVGIPGVWGRRGTTTPSRSSFAGPAFDCSAGGTEARVPGRGAPVGDKLTVHKEGFKILGPKPEFCDHGISPFKTLLTGST